MEKANNLIQDNVSKFSGVEITYKNRKVMSLTISKIVFWNSGQETISRNDLVKLNPLQIRGIEDTIILSGDILATSSPSNKFTLEFKPKNNQILMDFDYLDNGQGAVLQIVHTGAQENALDVLGDIKGVKSVRKYKQSKIAWRHLRFGFALVGTLILIGFPTLSFNNISLLIFIYLLIDLIGEINEIINKKIPPFPKEFASFIEQNPQ
jgi:hypothetical protein